MTFRKLILTYFKPKACEIIGDRIIYEFIGIKIFKKFLPTTGDLVRRKRKIIQIRISKKERIHELYKYELKTRNYEWRHWIGILLFIILTLSMGRKLTLFDWIFLPTLNTLVNVYPILLQRYNRIRILQTLKNNNLSSPYDL